ncbi:SRPBCC family protein [Petrachloros mirabilis]
MHSPVKWLGALALLCTELSLGLVFVLSSQAAVTASNSDVLDVTTETSGGVRARAHVTFHAKPSLILAMLTDYAHWPDLFEIRMRMADLKIRDGVALADVRIEHALLPGERRLVTRSRALSEHEIVTELVGGDFKKYRRVWKLTPLNGGTETGADFDLLVEIDSVVPDWLVALAMRRELEAHFRIVKEKALALSLRGN